MNNKESGIQQPERTLQEAMQRVDDLVAFGLVTFGGDINTTFGDMRERYEHLRLTMYEVTKELRKTNLFDPDQAQKVLRSAYGGGVVIDSASIGFEMECEPYDEEPIKESEANRRIVASVKFYLEDPVAMTETTEGYPCAVIVDEATFYIRIPTQVDRTGKLPQAKGFFSGPNNTNQLIQQMNFNRQLSNVEIDPLERLISKGLQANIRFEEKYVSGIIENLKNPEEREWIIKTQPEILTGYDFGQYLTAEEKILINTPRNLVPSTPPPTPYDNETPEERRKRLRPYRDDSNAFQMRILRS